MVRESQRRRYKDVGLVDRVLELDAQWREGELACRRAGIGGGGASGEGGAAGSLSLELLADERGPVARQATAGARPRQRCPRLSLANCIALRCCLLACLPVCLAAARGKLDGLNMEFNRLNKEIATLRKVGAGALSAELVGGLVGGLVGLVGAASPVNSQSNSAWSDCRGSACAALRRNFGLPAGTLRPAFHVHRIEPLLPLPPPLLLLLSPPSCRLQAKQDATELQEKSKQLKVNIKVAEEVEKALAEERDAALIPIGNLVPDSVPVDDDEVRGRSVAVWVGGRVDVKC